MHSSPFAQKLFSLNFGRATTYLAIIASCGFAASCGSSQQLESTRQRAPRFPLSVLDMPRTPDDFVASAVVSSLEKSQRPTFDQTDIRAARRVSANRPVWLLPATNGELCLTGLVYPLVAKAHSQQQLPPTPTLICDSALSTEAGELVRTQTLTTTDADSTFARVIGIVPNDVAMVTMISRHGARVSIPVIRNAYEAVVADPTSVRFITYTDGHTKTHLVPLVMFSARSPSPRNPSNGSELAED